MERIQIELKCTYIFFQNIYRKFTTCIYDVYMAKFFFVLKYTYVQTFFENSKEASNYQLKMQEN